MRITFEIPDDSSKETQEAVDHMKTDLEAQKFNAICFWLIKQCHATNAASATITQENVTYLDENIGNWKVTVEKV